MATTKKPKTNGKARTKSETYKDLADGAGLSRKQIGQVFDSLSDLIKKDLGNKGPGIFQIPGLVKIRVVQKPATKAREGVNPFTGEKMMFKAKPARRVVKAVPLKALKSMVK